MAEALMDTLIRLEPLIGRWAGRGEGRYPTIEPFRYREELTIALDGSYPMLAVEQRTWLLPDEEPSHWERGFIRPVGGGRVEYSSAQNSGRVEVLGGLVRAGQSNLVLESVALAHDPRLVATRREWRWSTGELSYRKLMSTTTTERPKMQQHLSARLRRVRD